LIGASERGSNFEKHVPIAAVAIVASDLNAAANTGLCMESTSNFSNVALAAMVSIHVNLDAEQPRLPALQSDGEIRG